MVSAVHLYFLALAATATFAQEPVKWTKVSVKFGILGGASWLNDEAFYEIPLTTEAATEEEWAQAASTDLTTIWCVNKDPTLCAMYDSQGTFAGMQISLPEDEIAFPDDDTVDNHPMLFKNNMYDMDLYSARFYVVPQATLEEGGRPPSEEVGTGLWLQSGSDLIEVPRDGNQLSPETWTRQKCYTMMGRHYYNMTDDMSCADLQPFFLMMDDETNSLHGVGFQVFGKATTDDGNYFEDLGEWILDVTIETGPPCLKEWTQEYGIISLHVYFLDKPWKISC